MALKENEREQLNGTIIGRILTASLVLSIVLLVILFIITGVWRGKREAYPPETESTICEPCSHLRIDNKIPSSCKVNETDTCCCKAKEVIDAVVKKSATEKFKVYNSREAAAFIKLDDECGDRQIASGKVFGVDYSCLKKDTREKDLIYWTKSENSILSSVRYTNGKFTINKSGFYYVFSQLRYCHDPDSAQNMTSRQVHTLHRYSLRTREEKLLESTRTFAELSFPENNGTSFIGAVFRLEANDDIMIKSSHTHRITGDGAENFFGLYII